MAENSTSVRNAISEPLLFDMAQEQKPFSGNVPAADISSPAEQQQVQGAPDGQQPHVEASALPHRAIPITRQSAHNAPGSKREKGFVLLLVFILLLYGQFAVLT